MLKEPATAAPLRPKQESVGNGGGDLVDTGATTGDTPDGRHRSEKDSQWHQA
jgi:hypothetical protein